MFGIKKTKRVHVRYFAALREQAGRTEEALETSARTPADLYAELVERYGLKVAGELLQVALNDRYSDMQGELHDGDRVAFIPPVSGG